MSQPLRLKEVRPTGGQAYMVQLEPVSRFLATPADDMDSPQRSSGLMLEEGTPLGPAHSLHDAIREHGGGLFSHWQNWLIFSARDGSDPRKNGRVYEFRARYLLVEPYREWAQLALIFFASLLAIPLLTVARLRRDLASTLAAMLQIGANVRFFRIARDNITTIMAVSGLIFSAVLAGSYERGLLDRYAVLQSSTIQAQSANAYFVSLNGIGEHYFLPDLIYPEDSNAGPNSSTLEIKENDRPLGPAHAPHSEIAALGEGRYSHWQTYLLFSSSDNTDPRSNGRVYSLSRSPNGILVLLITAAGILISFASIRSGFKTGGMAPVRAAIEIVLPSYLHVRGLVIRSRASDFTTLLIIIGMEAYFLWKFGLTPIEDRHGSFLNDGWFYARFADQLSFAPGVSTVALAEDWRNLFVSFFRMPGYPLVIAISKSLAGSNWQSFLVSVQLVFAVLASYSVFLVSRRISRHFLVGLGCAALFTFSHRIQFDRAILTDSLCTSAITILVCGAVMTSCQKKVPSLGSFLIAGLLLACLFWIRETIFIVAMAATPLALVVLSHQHSARAWLARLATLYLPVFVSLVLVLFLNYTRTGFLFVTTQGMSALVPAILLEKHGTSVFTGDNALDQVARETLRDYNYQETMEINRRLLLDYRMSGPEQSALGQQKYFQIWHDYPVIMTQMSIENFRVWPNVFVVAELIDLLPKWYNNYVLYARFFAYLCVIVLPLSMTALAIFVPTIRPMFLIVSALIVLIALPTFFYAVMGPIEIRYLIFATAPLSLIVALFIRSIGIGVSELLRRSRPAIAVGTVSDAAT
jgi:hypothetical protein